MQLMRRLIDAIKPAADAARKVQAPQGQPPGGGQQAAVAAGASPDQLQAMGTPGEMKAAA
jgi:hypothetical protein